MAASIMTDYSANWVATEKVQALPEDKFSHQLELSVLIQQGQTFSPIMEAFFSEV
jgi:hypothetical protein